MHRQQGSNLNWKSTCNSQSEAQMTELSCHATVILDSLIFERKGKKTSILLKIMLKGKKSEKAYGK